MYIVTFSGNCLFVCLFVTWLVQFETMSAFCELCQFQPLQTMLDLWHGMIHWDKWHFIMTSLALRHNMSILHCYMARSDVVRPLLDTRQERLQEKSEQGLQKIKTRPKKKENKANKKLKQVTQKIKMRCQVEHPKMWICRTCRRVHRHTVALWQSSNFSEMRMQITKRWNPSSSFLHWWM